MAKGMSIAERVEALVEPCITELGYLIWDVEYVKEGAEWYLRITLDSENGIDIDDCEKVSRAINPIIDEADPIEKQYVLEVSSPGIERKLITEEHVKKFLGYLATVRFVRAPEGYNQREFLLQLDDIQDGVITASFEDGTEMVFNKADTAFIKLYYDFNND